ncbi:conserved hypothetical protein (plasmid) [Pantoea sp. At-9b]|jgi:hypothetical protein|nr:conserved hypothetical protein [Pantoea sp. At-9b]
MYMTESKKKILSFFYPSNLEYIMKQIGPPPFDIYSISYLLYGPELYKHPVKRESSRRSLELMVRMGILIKSTHIEVRNGMTCRLSRYRLDPLYDITVY